MAKTSIYRNELMTERLAKYEKIHGGLSSAITVIADRYAELMRIERRSLRDYFSQEEMDLMLNNALSTTYEPAGIIAGAVLDDTEDEGKEVFSFYKVDKDFLLEKLRKLTPGQQFALVDWLEELRPLS